jgi:hypothetical protein
MNFKFVSSKIPQAMLELGQYMLRPSSSLSYRKELQLEIVGFENAIRFNQLMLR